MPSPKAITIRAKIPSTNRKTEWSRETSVPSVTIPHNPIFNKSAKATIKEPVNTRKIRPFTNCLLYIWPTPGMIDNMVAIFLCFEWFNPFAGSIDVCMFLPPFFFLHGRERIRASHIRGTNFTLFFLVMICLNITFNLFHCTIKRRFWCLFICNN
ncbi:Uncharacterised protein [Streptococcus pneumoniae]|nr:Uncharacterised protein [Streptococcus pneumoniae]